MHKKYDPRLVKSYRSYKVADVCRLFKSKKLHEQTIRSWIKSGRLKAIIHGKTIYIYGATLKQFLLDNNQSHKKTLEFEQFRCGKCKFISPPLNNIIMNLTNGRGGSIKAFAHCAKCNHLANRHYKASDIENITKVFAIKQIEVVRISDSSCSPSNTHIIDVSETAISELPESKAIDSNLKISDSISKTNIKHNKSSNSTSNANISPQLSLF